MDRGALHPTSCLVGSGAKLPNLIYISDKKSWCTREEYLYIRIVAATAVTQ